MNTSRMSSTSPLQYRDFTLRPWQPNDRAEAARVIATVLAEYGLSWDKADADRDAWEVEACYWQTRGEFWVITRAQTIVGTGGYYPVQRRPGAVEIRKMYLLPAARGLGLGRFLLQTLEGAIASRGFQEIWLETASCLQAAVRLYESSGYQLATGVETTRCDRVYVKPVSEPTGREPHARHGR